MDITSLAAGEVEEFLDLAMKINDHDRDAFPECRHVLRYMLTVDSPNVDLLPLAAIEDGRIVAAGTLLLPLRENTTQAQAAVLVDPDHRRRGFGTAMLEKLTALAREHGCSVLKGNVLHPLEGNTRWSDAGPPFATAHGFAPALTMTGLRLSLSAAESIGEKLWESVRDAIADYELASFTTPTPDEFAAGLAALASRVSSDVPHGELSVEEVSYGIERLREAEAIDAAQGISKLVTVARHRSTGDLAGYSTCLIYKSYPDRGSVGMTLVAPDHRGHRLGTALKLQLHRDLLREFPAVTLLETGNAVQNEPMLRVNRLVGFEPFGYITTYQRNLAE